MNCRSFSRIVLGLFLTLSFVTLNDSSRAQQDRGQIVRLRIGNARVVDLYAGSYALVIGVSDYTAGWHDLPGVRDDLPVVKATLENHGFQVTTVSNPTRRQFDDAVAEITDPVGPVNGSNRVTRGGGWGYGAVDCRSALRGSVTPGGRYGNLGFRLLRTYR